MSGVRDTTNIECAAIGMRRQADLALDSDDPRWSGIPEEWAYALIAVAGWLETEVTNLNLRTRPFAEAVAEAFIFGPEGEAH